jgi:hypothetical protein
MKSATAPAGLIAVIGKQERGSPSKALHGQALTRLVTIGVKIGRFSGLIGFSCYDTLHSLDQGSA